MIDSAVTKDAGRRRPAPAWKGDFGVKGVSKYVVEIVETQNEDIERVLVFLKPDGRAVRLGQGREAAEKYAMGLVSWRRRLLSPELAARLALAAALAAFLGLAAWLLLF